MPDSNQKNENSPGYYACIPGCCSCFCFLLAGGLIGFAGYVLSSDDSEKEGSVAGIALAVCGTLATWFFAVFLFCLPLIYVLFAPGEEGEAPPIVEWVEDKHERHRIQTERQRDKMTSSHQSAATALGRSSPECEGNAGSQGENVAEDVKGSLPAKKNFDTQQLQRSLCRCVDVLNYVVLVVGSGGILAGLLVGFLIHYLSKKDTVIGGHTLEKKHSLIGVGVSAFVFLVIIILRCLSHLLKRKLKQIVDEIAMDCVDEKQLQEKVAKHIMSQLEGKGGQLVKAKLLEAGIGEEQIERVLSAPPEVMQKALIDILVGRVLATYFSDFIIGMLQGFLDDFLLQLSLQLIIFPACVIFITFLLASFFAGTSFFPWTGVLFVLLLLSAIFLQQQWDNCFTVCSNLLLWSVAFLVISGGPTILGALLWVIGFFMLIPWTSLVIFAYCYLKPVILAAFDVGCELLRIDIYTSFGLTRDPKTLEELQATLEQKTGKTPMKWFKRLLGVPQDNEATPLKATE